MMATRTSLRRKCKLRLSTGSDTDLTPEKSEQNSKTVEVKTANAKKRTVARTKSSAKKGKPELSAGNHDDTVAKKRPSTAAEKPKKTSEPMESPVKTANAKKRNRESDSPTENRESKVPRKKEVEFPMFHVDDNLSDVLNSDSSVQQDSGTDSEKEETYTPSSTRKERALRRSQIATETLSETKTFSPIQKLYRSRRERLEAQKAAAASAEPPKTFLKSLDFGTPVNAAHKDAVKYLQNFGRHKNELTAKLYKMFNEKVFANRLPADMEIKWRSSKRKNCGSCFLKQIRYSTGQVTRAARISLVKNMTYTPDRLRDTVIHEMCHAAAWLFDGHRDDHGPAWTKYTEKAQQAFPELPKLTPGHTYTSIGKYVYKCAACGYRVTRSSKSLDVDRHICGVCYGHFEVFTQNRVTGDLRPVRPPNFYNIFVSENYDKVKRPGMKHTDVMKAISELYRKEN